MDKDMQLLISLMARAIPLIPRPIIHRLSRRYIAGATIEEAVDRTRRLNAQGFCTTLDVLGESISAKRGPRRPSTSGSSMQSVSRLCVPTCR
jgi:proline dehydrogenase